MSATTTRTPARHREERAREATPGTASASLVKHGQIDELDEGFVIEHPRREESYEVQYKLGEGGEGHTYLVLDQDGNRKTLKIVTPGSGRLARGLEEKISSELRRVNAALDNQHTVFPVNPLDVAVVGDYYQGVDLVNHIESRDRVYTEVEVVDCLLQIIGKQVGPLHEHDLVHRDIKPQNVIVNTEGDEPVYDLTDFGSLRAHEATATLTMNFKLSLGYSRLKEVYEKQDDLRSMAKMAYYLLTGNHPSMIDDEEYEKRYDEEKFGALDVTEDFRQILFTMLGHDREYDSYNKLVRDLEGLTRSSVGEVRSLEATRVLVAYRESLEVPLALRQDMNGVLELFEGKYSRVKPDRVELDKGLRVNIRNILLRLGYVEREFFKTVETPIAEEDLDLPQNKGKTVHTKTEKLFDAYVRHRKDSDSIDVFRFRTEEGRERYFDYFQVEDVDNVVAKMEPLDLERYKNFHKVPALVLGFFGPLAAGVTLDLMYTANTDLGGIPTVAGAVIGFFSAILNSSEADRSYAWALTGFGIPHAVGRYVHDRALEAGDYNYSVERNLGLADKLRLEKALTPAEHFTYE